MIAAASLNGVIGYNNDLHGAPVPWNHDYKEDMKFFKDMTLDSTVIMGRKTYQTMGKPLPKRRNIVLSRTRKIDGVEVFTSMADAIASCKDKEWIIGGSFIYQEGLRYAKDL